jgi:hypothetical protein
VVSRIKAQPDLYPKLDLAYSSSQPLHHPVVVSVPAIGVRLRFDGPDQRLRLIEVLDFSKASFTYHNTEVVKKPKASDDTGAQPIPVPGPSFRHVYHRLVGPAYEGEYVAPSSASDKGTYVLSYPGLAFSFPVQHKLWSEKADFVRLLDSAAAGPATSMAIFHGPSWPESRGTLFTAVPSLPRSAALAGKATEHIADEIEEVRLHGAGRLEFIRGASSPVLLHMSETTPQDLVAEFGPPDAIYRKHDNRISIHASRTPGHRRPSMSPGLDPHALDTDHSSIRSYTDDSDAEAAGTSEDDEDKTACFYNYFHHGFDALVSQPRPRSPAFPGQEEAGTSDNHSSKPVVTKIFLHGNVPGSYSFNRHRRSRWKIITSSQPAAPVLSSEMPFSEISAELGRVWQNSYEEEDEQKKMQRGMVLNRGWGESPDSSIELLGGFEDGASVIEKDTQPTSDSTAALNSTELFGFPGMLFEVLKNDAISCLTIY